MRLLIRLSKSNEVIYFNYQHLLTGCVHKWLGKDNLQHGRISLYSFSWLQNVYTEKNGIRVKDGSFFTLGFHEMDLVKIVVGNILNDPEMFFGVRVTDVHLQETPNFSTKERFVLASPVLIKRYDENRHTTHYTFAYEKSDEFLTETLKNKARTAGLDPGDVKVYFDRSYHSPRTKLITYKETQNRVSLCPIIIEGSSEIIAFAWHVGVGNSTGIGFGALK